MNRRLIRALQRGGLAAQIERDRWGIWRGRDRRGRMIGVLTGAEIDVLRVREALRPYGDGVPPILIWSGSVLDLTEHAPSARALNSVPHVAGGSLVEGLIARCHDLELRQLLRETVQKYRADLACAGSAGATSGMNWDGLALGGRIDGGRGRAAAGSEDRAAHAAALLRTIHAALGRDNVDFLNRLIVLEDCQSRLIKRYGLRPSLLERRATAAVRALHETYQTLVGSSA